MLLGRAGRVGRYEEIVLERLTGSLALGELNVAGLEFPLSVIPWRGRIARVPSLRHPARWDSRAGKSRARLVGMTVHFFWEARRIDRRGVAPLRGLRSEGESSPCGVALVKELRKC